MKMGLDKAKTLFSGTKRPRVFSPIRSLAAALPLLLWGFHSSEAADGAGAPDADELMKQSHLNYFYVADDGRAEVTMEITNKRGRSRTRKLVLLRKDLEEGGDQRYFAYFFEPTDVKRTTFMAWKNPKDDDARWIYVPAVDLVKPISANDKKSSFVGSDFSYEDVSGRHWSEDNHKFLREEMLNDRASYLIESTPKSEDYFARKLTWIDKEWMLPMKEEFYEEGKDSPQRTFEALNTEVVDGHRTIVHRQMTNHDKGNHTVVTMSNVEYDLGIGEEVFSERFLKSPPREYIK